MSGRVAALPQITYLGDLNSAGPVKDGDTTFWCDSSLCSAGIDLKSQSAAHIATYVLSKLATPGSGPLQMVGNQLTFAYDHSTLAVVNGALKVIGGGPGSGDGQGGFPPGGTLGQVQINAGVNGFSGITMSGDATWNTTTGALALSSTGGQGTWNQVTVNQQGRVTSGSNQPYLTGNQSITLANDVTGSGTTSIAAQVVALRGRAISTNTPNANDALLFVGGQWTPQAIQQSGLTAPTGPLVSSNGSQLGNVTIGPTLELTGNFPNYELNALSESGTPLLTPPGGTNGQIQFNNNGGFGGLTASSDFVINPSAETLVLSSINANVGTYQGIAVNAQGRVTSATNMNYAPLTSPVLAGNPTAPAPPAGANDNSLAIANTAWVTSKLQAATAGVSQITATSPIVASQATGAVALSMASTGFSGTYQGLTIDGFGRVTGGSNMNYLTGNQQITLTGDVTSAANATTLNGTVVALRNQPISATAPSAGQLLQFNSGQWTPTTVALGGGTVNAGSQGQIAQYTGAGSVAVVSGVTMSGDATIANGGQLTLANTGVTANTYTSVTVDAKGRVTAGSNPTPSVTLAGDVTGASGTTTVARIRGTNVSATPPTTNQFMRYDGTNWSAQTVTIPPAITVPTANLLGGDGTNLVGITLGTNLSITDGVLNAAGGAPGTGNPGGSLYQMQFNRGSNQFGGSASITADTTTNLVGQVTISNTGSPTTGMGTLVVQSGANQPPGQSLGTGAVNVARIVQVNKNANVSPALDPDHTAFQAMGLDGNSIRMALYGFGTATPNILTQYAGFAAGGTGANPAALPADKVMLQLAAFGHTGGAGALGWLGRDINIPVCINMVSNEQFSSAAQGTRIEFYTTQNGSLLSLNPMTLRTGVIVGSNTTANDMGVGTLNAINGVYDNGVRLGPSVITASIGWTAGTDPNFVTAYINNSGRALTCTWITAICEIANGTNAFVDVYAAGNNTTIANAGAKVNTTAFNANGVGGQYQTLLQSGTFVLNPGDRLGLRVQTPAPTWTASVATFTFNLV